MKNIINDLLSLPKETEWIEFKQNYCESNFDSIGEYISALSNSAALHDKPFGYLLFGVNDESHAITGTTFNPTITKVGNEELENWLAHMLSPRIDFRIHELIYDGKPLAIFEVPRASHQPVKFRSSEYIRIGSIKKKLGDYPEKERALWKSFDKTPYEKHIARERVSSADILTLIDYPAYFDQTEQSLPDNRNGILEKLSLEKFIVHRHGDTYDITNLGAILYAKKLVSFDRLARKAIRVIVYKGNDRVETIREQEGVLGYAVGFEGAINFINMLLPQNEIIGEALRKNIKMYPEIAIRELVANALIHQDFSISGAGPMIEIFSDRIEITNPGQPLIDTDRFVDLLQSRNESLASFMRRINICEERGSGINKVLTAVEFYQLPAPEFVDTDTNTKAILFAPKKYSRMDKKDRVRACYQHTCLKYDNRDFMTNESLRERFGIEKHNYSMISRIIKDTITAGYIKRYDPENTGKRNAKYVPQWA